MRDRALALIAGLLFPLAFSPYGWWPLLFVSIAISFFAFHTALSAREALLRGWLYGMGLFGFGVSWVHVSMHSYGFVPLWQAIPFTALFAAFLALFYGLSFYLSWRVGRRSAFVFTGFWLLLDWTRGWFLTGFPWLYAGYALIDSPFAALAPLGGVWLLTLAAVLLSAGLLAIRLPGTGRKSAIAALAMLAVLVPLSHTFNFTRPAGESQAVVLAQGNIPQDLKWQASMRERTKDIYRELTIDSPNDTLVIWPEAALTELYQSIPEFIETEGQRFAERGGAFITGVPWGWRRNGEVIYHNSIASIPLDTGSGQLRVYHKQKLVPFGEYVPLQAWLRGIIPFFDLPMSSFTPGDAEQPNLNALGHSIAPFICYEILYPELVATRSHNADVLLTISNDAWFGTSAGPWQHFQMARLRALETGRWLLRATNNGVTAVIDHRGQIVDILPQFERAVLHSAYQPRQGTTPFMHTGVWPWLLLAGALVLIGRKQARQANSA